MDRSKARPRKELRHEEARSSVQQRHIAGRYGSVGNNLLNPAPAQQHPPAVAGSRKPNILVIFGDDIGYGNISVNNRGMMGYRTPNIDRIAKEGATFTDLYAEQSCTAGRAAFITGQSCFRTGLLKVGLPAPRRDCPTKNRRLAVWAHPTIAVQRCRHIDRGQ